MSVHEILANLSEGIDTDSQGSGPSIERQAARAARARWLSEVLTPLDSVEELGRFLPPQARYVGPGPWIEALEAYNRSEA